MYRHLGWCLAEVPDQILDPMMEIPEAEQGVASLKDLMSRVVLVGSGAQPLQYLNRALELFMYSNTKYVANEVLNFFYKISVINLSLLFVFVSVRNILMQNCDIYLM